MKNNLCIAFGAVILCSLALPNALTTSAFAQGKNASQTDVAALKAEIEALKRLVPSQSHAMADVDYHFANLWFAAQNANWPLADTV